MWTVVNGEIFNYRTARELEAEAAVYKHSTRRDRASVRRDGDRSSKDQGQFAIRMGRGAAGGVARDAPASSDVSRASGGRVWFASETKALLAVLPQCAALDPLGIAQTFATWSPIEPHTVYRGIDSLPPGHTLAIEHDGRETLRQYWDWTFPDAAETSPSRYH